MHDSQTAPEISLYEQLGGEAAVDAAVDVFYRKVLSDDRISHFFDNVDMDRQIAKQKGFLTMVLGPVAYTRTCAQDMLTLSPVAQTILMSMP
ncbi:MAG: group 1 truncated hemoglobin [Bryobacteraceae bacterium]